MWNNCGPMDCSPAAPLSMWCWLWRWRRLMNQRRSFKRWKAKKTDSPGGLPACTHLDPDPVKPFWMTGSRAVKNHIPVVSHWVCSSPRKWVQGFLVNKQGRTRILKETDNQRIPAFLLGNAFPVSLQHKGEIGFSRQRYWMGYHHFLLQDMDKYMLSANAYFIYSLNLYICYSCYVFHHRSGHSNTC